MNFYYNGDLNMCASEDAVIDYLISEEYVTSKEEALWELNSSFEFYGWFNCEVSEDISNFFKKT